MEKRNKVIYWIATGLFSALMIFSPVMYVIQNEMTREMFTSLGYPTYIIYPLAIAKLLGITAILTKKSTVLKEWAYAGFFFELLLASMAHFSVGDGGFVAPLVAIALLLTSRLYDPKVFGSQSSEARGFEHKPASSFAGEVG